MVLMLKCSIVRGGGMRMKTNRKSDCSIIVQGFRKVIGACPMYFLFICIIDLLLGLTLALNTLALDNFFSLVGQYVSGKTVLSGVLSSLILLILCILANPVLNGLSTVFCLDYERKVIGKLEKIFNDKCAMQQTASFEETSFLDDINKAQKGVKNSVSLITGIVDATLIYIPYFLIIGVYLYSLKPNLIIIIFLFSIPIMFSQMFKSKLYARLEDKAAPLRRECDHYGECIIGKEKFKETRLLGAYNFFIKRYKNRLQTLNNVTMKTQVKSIRIELLFKIPVLLGHVITLLLLVRYLLDGSISVGNFGAILASTAMIMNMLEQMICYIIGNSMKQIGTVDNYLKFMNIKESVGKQINYEKAPAIELKDVSFSYPGSKKDVISKVSIKFDSEEVIAIVGENGAGKSTLVKLISGIYLPNKGSVYFNGEDTRGLDPKTLMSNISSVFQDFQRYKMTLQDNIIISDTSTTLINQCAQNSLKEADLNVNSKVFPQGMNTMLSRDFDGVDLSGGLWQRVAIARGFYKKHNMILLDEPTAAIDPVEESKLYMKFIELSKGKTSFIVTHRLSLTKMADRVVVMDQGKVVQIGTHKELISVKGKYQELYNSQSKWYIES
ncbi:MAG: ABC transporter ATP-binding protein [Clostridium sulfidigenes]|uniref:ABC transporter ATP-binding protein n=1 Tax=Clostridium sulfidigenes TaxID=318464 RepID=A0A927W8Z1_9CLOT|nr:ABC transporter ATP-binding protein [Clostridium sulfidigenes]